MKHEKLRRLVRVPYAIGALSVMGALTAPLVSNMAPASASQTMQSAVDCSQPFGEPQTGTSVYIATITGNQATVTLGANCTNGPYFLAVYTTSANDWGAPGAYPVSGPNFPVVADFPETIVGSVVTFQPSSDGTLTATVTLPTCSSWELDAYSYGANGSVSDVPTSFTYEQAINLGFPPGVWAELGPWSLVNNVPTPSPLPSTCSTPGPGPFTIGYWKHWNSINSTNPGSSSNPLMDTYLPQYLGNYYVSKAAEGVAVLSDPSSKYAENQLAAQLLAAELNVAAHAASCPQLPAAITEANSLLSGIGYAGPPGTAVGPSAPNRAAFVSTASTLNSYNNGQLC